MRYFIKRFSILLTISMLTTGLFAQYGDQLINRGFEDWTNRDSEPVHWHSNGTATGTFASMLPSDQIEQSGHPRPGSSGSKSVRLIPKSVWGVTANGNLTTGRMNAGSMSATGSSNYNQTKRSESAFNMPLSMLPDSLTIWVCFRSNSSSTKAQVKAVVHGNADYKIIANGTEDPTNMHVATAVLSFNRTSTSGGSYTWRRMSIPFNNNGPCTDVRYVLMTATTNETPGSGSTDDDLFIDDALLVYNPTLAMGQLASNSFAPSDAITIPFTLTGTMSPDNFNASANVVIAQMSDANGSFSNPTELGRVTTNTSGSISTQIPSNANGQYTIRVISTNYPMIGQNAQQVTIANPTFTVSVSANPSVGGTVAGGGEYNSGQSCTVSATANTGYTFANWTENGTQVSTNANYTFNVTGNRSLVANFTLNSYSITASADPSAGGTVSGAGSYGHGESCTLTATANAGYSFVNWTKNGTQVSTNASYTFTVTEAGEYVAHFSLNNYNITATANPSAGGTVSGAGTYNHGASCTLTATASTGYTFTNWTENGNVVSTNANYTFNVTGNRTLVANFALNTYTITASANPSNGGTVSGAGAYNHGASCTLSATANTGYTFVKWTKNGSQVSTSANYTFTVTEAGEYVAHFSLNSYNVNATANPSNGGTVSGAGTYNHGASCTLTATANTGYTFTNWTENGTQVSTNPSYTFTIEGGRNLVANFTVISYSITVSANPSNGGTALGGGTYTYGQNCTLTATAATGYTFVKWTKNGTQVSTNASYPFVVTASASYVAHFQANSYTIIVTASPSAGGMVSGGGIYTYSQLCTVHATVNSGYAFTNWTVNGSQVSTDASYTFRVTGNCTLTANFTYIGGGNAPTGAINGVFSVSASQRVYFSQGNLQYRASTNTWRFAESQLDYRGSNNANISPSYSDWIDLFGWGTSGWNCGNTYYRPCDSNNSDGSLYGPPGQYNLTGSYASSDWGRYNAISNGGNTSNTWRTLTQSEWDYVFNTRSTSSGIRYAKAQVNNVNGVILLPDNWSSSYYTLYSTNQGGVSFSSNIIGSSTWTNSLQPHGAVFLPAAGRRYGSSVYNVGTLGYYWSASYNSSDRAWGVNFGYGDLNTNDWNDRYVGRSVRLVCPAQ